MLLPLVIVQAPPRERRSSEPEAPDTAKALPPAVSLSNRRNMAPCFAASCAARFRYRARHSPFSQPQPARYDVLIRNGRVLDGSGNPWFATDIGIRGGRIVDMGRLGNAPAARVIDARGHDGLARLHRRALARLAGPRRRPQGGAPAARAGHHDGALNPDGGGTTDLRTQRAGFEQRGVGVNVALYVPHGAIRREVVGMADRAPTAAELDAHDRRWRSNGMEAGGIGLSSGLYYAPGSYAKTEEVIALAKVVGEMGGVYESHIRDEADYNIGVVGAVQEVIRIAEEGHLPGIVAHMKALGPASWGLSMALVERITQARDRGVEVYADQYPYDASGTGIVGALIPRWAEVGGRAELLEADSGAGARSARRRHPPQLRAARRPGQARDLALRAEPGDRGSDARAGGEGDRQAAGRDGNGSAGEGGREPRVVQHDRDATSS